MRVLLISHSSPLKEGGAETRTREVAFRLACLGHRVTVLCGKTDVDDPDLAEVNGVTMVCKKTLPDSLLKRFPYPHYIPLAAANLFLMFPAFFFLRKESFDLIREDMAPFPPTFLLSLAKLPASRRIVVVHMLAKTLRGWVKYYGLFFGFGGFIMDRLLRAGLLKYDRIVSDSKWFAEELKTHRAISNRVRYVPNGVNLEDFKPARIGRENNGQIKLLSVGRLVETKGHKFAIEALAYLKKEYPDIRLDILGNGPMREPLTQLANDLGVAHMLEIRAPISHQEMPHLYAEYDFFVMPSIWEGLPVSLIEAMASGLPIIAADITALTDVLDKNSATFAVSEDAADLAEKLRWAFEHPGEIRSRAESAYEIAKSFDWAMTALHEIGEADDE